MLRPLNILFVEDSERDFGLVRLHLEDAGLAARLTRVGDAQALADALATRGWDLVLADYKVPGLAWQDSLAALRSHDPDLPIILVSGSVGEEKAVQLLKDGAWDFVLKDRLLRLLPAIERSLSEAQARRARSAAEAELQQSEERLQLALQGASDGVWDWTPEQDCLFLSPGWKAMLGHADAELENAWPAFERLLHPEDLPATQARLHEVIASERTFFSLEYRLRHHAGHYVDVLSRGIVLRDVTGQARRLVGTHTDVSASRRLEQTQCALLEAALDAVLATDQAGRIVLVNDQCERLLGYRREELMGQTIEMLVPQRYRDVHVAHRERFWNGPSARPMGKGQALWVRRRNGTEFAAEIRLSPLTLPHGQVTYATIRDVTELRQAMERLQRYANEQSLRKDQAEAALAHSKSSSDQASSPAAPARPLAARPTGEVSDTAPASVNGVRRARVVIVDDQPVERAYLRTVLEYAGHEVLEAWHGAEALTLVRDERPDLVISDLLMPVMDGSAFASALHSDPEIAATPLIFCTGTYRQREVRLMAKAARAHYLLKPVDPVVLLDAVQQALRQAVQPATPQLPPDEVERAHLRLLNDKLMAQIQDLQRRIQDYENRLATGGQ